MSISSISSVFSSPAQWQYPVQTLPSGQALSALEAEFPTQARDTLLQNYPIQTLNLPATTNASNNVLSQYMLFSNYLTSILPSAQQTFPIKQTGQASPPPFTTQFQDWLNGTRSSQATSQPPTGWNWNATTPIGQFMSQLQPPSHNLGTLLNTTA